jgi:hypothetical protein
LEDGVVEGPGLLRVADTDARQPRLGPENLGDPIRAFGMQVPSCSDTGAFEHGNHFGLQVLGDRLEDGPNQVVKEVGAI